MLAGPRNRRRSMDDVGWYSIAEMKGWDGMGWNWITEGCMYSTETTYHPSRDYFYENQRVSITYSIINLNLSRNYHIAQSVYIYPIISYPSPPLFFYKQIPIPSPTHYARTLSQPFPLANSHKIPRAFSIPPHTLPLCCPVLPLCLLPLKWPFTPLRTP